MVPVLLPLLSHVYIYPRYSLTLSSTGLESLTINHKEI